jgi:hypothetical protein
MSLEATNHTEATRKRNTPAPYWTFFTTEGLAFWNFVDHSRDDAKTQPQGTDSTQNSLTNASHRAEDSRAPTPHTVGPREGEWYS